MIKNFYDVATVLRQEITPVLLKRLAKKKLITQTDVKLNSRLTCT